MSNTTAAIVSVVAMLTIAIRVRPRTNSCCGNEERLRRRPTRRRTAARRAERGLPDAYSACLYSQSRRPPANLRGRCCVATSSASAAASVRRG